MSTQKVVLFLSKLISTTHAVPLVEFTAAKWGGPDVFRRFYQRLNRSWREARGNDLFEVVGSVTRGANGEDFRKFKLVDPDIASLRMMSQPLMPAFIEFIPALKGTILEEHVESVYRRRFGSNSPDTFRTNLEKKFLCVDRGRRSYVKYTAVLRSIWDALILEKVLRVTRKSSSQKIPIKEDLLPRTLVLYQGGLYLIAEARVPRDPSRPILQKYRVESIIDAECLHKVPAPYPRDYSPNSVFGDFFGFMHTDNPFEVTIAVEPGWALDYLRERQWSKSDLWDTVHGSHRLTFKASNTGEVARWLLTFDTQVHVLSPNSLRAEIEAMAASIASSYRQKAS